MSPSVVMIPDVVPKLKPVMNECLMVHYTSMPLFVKLFVAESKMHAQFSTRGVLLLDFT
jgi:hypothetical protein